MSQAPAFRLGLELVDWLSAEHRMNAAQLAERQGFDDLFMAEIGDPDAFVIAGLLLAQTSSIRFGTCIVQIGPRSVPMIAASAATIATAARAGAKSPPCRSAIEVCSTAFEEAMKLPS